MRRWMEYLLWILGLALTYALFTYLVYPLVFGLEQREGVSYFALTLIVALIEMAAGAAVLWRYVRVPEPPAPDPALVDPGNGAPPEPAAPPPAPLPRPARFFLGGVGAALVLLSIFLFEAVCLASMFPGSRPPSPGT